MHAQPWVNKSDDLYHTNPLTCSRTYSSGDCSSCMREGMAPASMTARVWRVEPEAMLVNTQAASNWKDHYNRDHSYHPRGVSLSRTCIPGALLLWSHRETAPDEEDSRERWPLELEDGVLTNNFVVYHDINTVRPIHIMSVPIKEKTSFQG